MRKCGADSWAIVSHCSHRMRRAGGFFFFVCVPLQNSCCMQYLVECSFTVVLVLSPLSACAAMLGVLPLGHISRLVWSLRFFPFEFRNFWS